MSAKSVVEDAMGKMRWQDMVSVVVGVGLAVSPWALGFAEELQLAMWSALIAGGVIVVLAAIDLDSPAQWEEWGIAVAGAWTIASPFVLGFAGHGLAMANAVLAGAVVLALAGWTLLATKSWGKGEDHAHSH
jgi:hypothetical protein